MGQFEAPCAASLIDLNLVLRKASIISPLLYKQGFMVGWDLYSKTERCARNCLTISCLDSVALFMTYDYFGGTYIW